MKKLILVKKQYLNQLDSRARHLAYFLTQKKRISKLLMTYITDLYNSAKVEEHFSNNNFKSAYHNPITSELEFLIARILYYFSNYNNLNWKIYLRKQKKTKKTHHMITPDIKIEKSGKIIAIMEIKAKAGWIQPFFSDKRAQRDREQGKDPDKLISKARNQLLKYSEICNKRRIFVILPTFAHVSRIKYGNSSEDYRKTFARNSTLSKNNLIILSRNTKLNLSENNTLGAYEPTEDFENLMKKLKRLK